MDDRKTIIRLDDPSFEWKEEAPAEKPAPAVVPASAPSAEPAVISADLPVTETVVVPSAPAAAARYAHTESEGPSLAAPARSVQAETERPARAAYERPAHAAPEVPAHTAPVGPANGTAARSVYAETERPARAAYERPAHAAPEGPAHAAPVSAPPKKKVREKKYVTRGTLVVFMIITMIVSAMLGAVAGVLFSQTGGGTVKERVDSELSHLNLGDATGGELTVAEIIQKNEDSVVEIVVSGTTQGIWGQLELTQGAGSGVIVSEDGYIATNYHVIEGANKVEVTLHNGDTYNATIAGSDSMNDIAVIKIDAKDLIPATIGDSSKLSVGDLAVAIGNPLGQLGGTATAGIISALDRNLTIEGTPLTLIQTDAAINGGNSGGGLFDSRGELIGIVESKASAVGVEGLAFALPINSVSGIINDLIENGGENTTARETPAVGVVISEVSEENAKYYGLDKAGVYIAQVTGENAKNAGFQEKDRIISIDGKEIKSSNEFISIIRKHKIGDTVTVVVERNGQEMEIKTELEALADTSADE